MSTTAFRAIGVLVRDSPIEKFHIDRIEIALMRLNMKALRALTPVLLAMQAMVAAPAITEAASAAVINAEVDATFHS